MFRLLGKKIIEIVSSKFLLNWIYGFTMKSLDSFYHSLLVHVTSILLEQSRCLVYPINVTARHVIIL